MKVIEGNGAILGRLATFAAKEALKGEDIVIVDCKNVVITGNKKFFQEKLKDRRGRVGSGQKGPKVSKVDYMLVKRAIRGMLPNHRFGRGKIAFSKIRCYNEIPKEFENEKRIKINEEFKGKHILIREISK